MMQAWEIKNKFVHTLRNFSEKEIDKLWREFLRETNNTDEHAFVDWLELLYPERFD
jgi:hypothetical protein